MTYLYSQTQPAFTFGEPPATAQATISLTGPGVIVRGTRGEYVVKNAPQGSTFSKWKFTAGRVVISRAGDNNVDNWAGTVVQSGTIEVDVKEPGGNQRTLRLAVVVTPRGWSENVASIPLVRLGHGTLPTQPRLGIPGLIPGDAGLGISKHDGVHTVTTRIVNGGPNAGYNYLDAAPVTWTTRVFINGALYDPSHPFNRAHDPARRGTPLPGGRLQIGTIRTNVEAHEGVIVPPRGAPANYASHHQALVNHLRRNPINSVVERDVSHPSVETNQNYARRIDTVVRRLIERAKDASRPHPKDIFPGPMYFNYPYINSRSLRLIVGGSSAQMTVTNPAGGTKWASTNPAVARIDGNGKVKPVAAGSAVIRVTNRDGDVDEIPVTVSR